jgi:H(+)-translocating pyrophosphatase
VAGITVVSLAVLGICVLFSVCNVFVEDEVTEVPELLIGYGFGASFVAMFAQLGGGIFTKAADVGADLCGKIEGGIDEDDMRNPAVLADLVGDNVGDCCARGADLFESLSAEILAAMILGGKLIHDLGTDLGPLGREKKMDYMLFPLVVHVADMIVSFVGVMSVRTTGSEVSDPMVPLKQGYKVAVGLAAIFFAAATKVLLHVESAPDAWWHFLLCGLYGMVTGFLIVLITQYYTDFNYGPVQRIALASTHGHGTNIIAGLGVGFESTMLPILLVLSAILASYFLGKSTGLHTESGDTTAAGLFGTAVATMGMLSNLTYVLAMDVFGPIADNAAGIVEFSSDENDPTMHQARDIMDRLDAVGNTTKAFTKGFAVGSAGLACFLLFTAFLDIVYAYTNEKISIDIVQPEVFSAGLIGSTTVFLFAAFAMDAVGVTAQQVVEEVRRQWADGEVMAFRRKPDYFKCVELVSQASIQMMVKPGLLVVLMPMAVGGGFRLVGDATGDDLLGAKSMTSYLVCSSMTAMLVALFLNNGGGAWDNSKKYIESGHHGGKRSPAHQCAVTGDTVGDPCKDTAGPSLHVLMKLTATVTMVVGPLIAVPGKGASPALTTA